MVRIEKVSALLFLLLCASLPMLADAYVLVLLSRQMGIYLLLAIEAATGLIAVIGILSSYRNSLTRIRSAVRESIDPVAEYRWISCLWAAAVLLAVPGFVTDVLGLAVLVPPLRWAAGSWIVAAARAGFDEVTEYLKLGE
jgi:UPF0716 protein FxsA